MSSFYTPVNLFISLAAAIIPKLAVTATDAPKPEAQSKRVLPSSMDLLKHTEPSGCG
ncbi:MAG: hypothetical protein GY770_23485 [Aestuariibacter sp.]|nr:hypothetical protein [Aestuariibacter sp.]